MGTIIARLKEPSTYAGLAGVSLAVGQAWPHVQHVTAVVAGVLGYLAAHMADQPAVERAP